MWLSALDAYAAAIRVEVAARYEARVEAIIWMSGSADFGPEGQAHAGWVKVRDGVLAAALAALEHEEVT